MAPNTKKLKSIVANSFTRPAATLQDVHDQEPDPRLRSYLFRLETVLDASLETMPANFGWFDAHFAQEGFHSAMAHRSSAKAYSRWRNTIRRAIRRHAVGCGTSNLPISLLQMRQLSATSAQYNPPIPATKMLGHTDVERLRAYYTNFREAAAGPKSD
tara:strand:- start:1223 stop:1696 length:474 start_codon:yes stop_codon:yes gene_type:complete